MRNTQIGIVGGGQLGMFLLQEAINFPAHVAVYDPDASCSASFFTKSFTQGAFEDTEAIIAFAKDCDVVLFETEKTSLEALKALEAQGKTVLSSVHALDWIQDKGTQRQKLADAGFPVPGYELVEADQVNTYSGNLPAVFKWRTGGYDGKGVQMVKSSSDLESLEAVDGVFEELIDIQYEISVLIARDKDGNTAVYDPIEMVFDEEANLVDYLVAPARISTELSQELLEMSKKLVEHFEFVGIYAIEYFVDNNDQVYVNEIAPRPHNSGHHTLSANVTSQYEQQIRMALGLPLGSTKMLSPCVMLNLLGEGEQGPTHYQGIEKAFTIPNVQYMFYGKSEVRPKRKMGHALILDESIDEALKKADDIRTTLSIINHD